MPPPASPITSDPSADFSKVAPDVYYRLDLSGGDVAETYVFYFQLGATALSPTHRKYIRGAATKMTDPDSVVEMYGVADTTGSNARNFEVAGKRLMNVQTALTMAGAPAKKVFNPANKNLGEEYSATVDDDEFPDERLRMVVVYIWATEMLRRQVYNDKGFLKFARAF